MSVHGGTSGPEPSPDGGLLHRARTVRSALEALWGDELPPGEDPVTAVLADAVAADDEAGREAGYVVTGDRLGVAELAALLALPGDARERAARLPDGLRSRVEALLAPPHPHDSPARRHDRSHSCSTS